MTAVRQKAWKETLRFPERLDYEMLAGIKMFALPQHRIQPLVMRPQASVGLAPSWVNMTGGTYWIGAVSVVQLPQHDAALIDVSEQAYGTDVPEVTTCLKAPEGGAGS